MSGAKRYGAEGCQGVACSCSIDTAKDEWLQDLAAIAISSDYPAHVDAWLASFARTSARLFTLTLDARLLIGHGDTSGTDVGLNVHHTWGVPIVPGSALKGTLAHHVAAAYGADPQVTTPDPARDPWRGVGWAGAAIARGPGDLYRALFETEHLGLLGRLRRGLWFTESRLAEHHELVDALHKEVAYALVAAEYSVVACGGEELIAEAPADEKGDGLRVIRHLVEMSALARPRSGHDGRTKGGDQVCQCFPGG